MARKTKYAVPAGLEPGKRRRPARVADLIRNEVAMLLLGKIKDPRLANVSVTEVQVTNDLRLARIFYSVFGEENSPEVKKGLASARGFIRSYLAQQLDLRYAPEIEFKEDVSRQQQERLEKLLQEIKSEPGDSTS